MDYCNENLSELLSTYGQRSDICRPTQGDIESLGLQANTLSAGAVQCLVEKAPEKRRKLSADKKKTREYLDLLHEERGLVKIEPTGDKTFKSAQTGGTNHAKTHRPGGQR